MEAHSRGGRTLSFASRATGKARSRAPTERPASIGRFRVERVLGRGSQGQVFLATDPNLDRRVAVKTLHARGDGADQAALLREARVVGQLAHPHIVPVYEIGEHGGAPYIVYEYVEGRTLRERLRSGEPVPPADAVRWCREVLDGIGSAHLAGVVHRDLNPSNIRIDQAGRARVMDFGIATAIGTRTRGIEGVIGTARYLAPEQLDSGAVGPATDVFAIGLVLHEMLTGEPAIRADDAVSAMYQIAHEPIPAPSRVRAGIDPGLDRIVEKALRKKPSERYPSAAEMGSALEAWAADGAGPETTDDGAGSTVSFLLRRMRRNSDFPAVSAHISEIREKTASGTRAKVSDVANTILKDYALATKLLKLVNSSFYGQYGGRINTISRAVVILGYEQVRVAALSLLLFEHLDNRPQAEQLKESACQAFLSGVIGRELAAHSKQVEPEESFVCAMLNTLGRFLTIYYLSDEFAEVCRLAEQRGLEERVAARQVLGVTYEELGVAIAREWQLPVDVVASMRPLPEGPLERAGNKREAIRQVAGFSNELCAVLTDANGDTRAERLDEVRRRYAKSLPLKGDRLKTVISDAVAGAREYMAAIRADFRRTDSMNRAIDYTGTGAAPSNDAGTSAPAGADTADCAGAVAGTHAVAEVAGDRQLALMNGIQDIINALLEGCALNDVLVMILETMFRGFGFRRVVFLVADRKHNLMTARFGLGPEVDRLIKRFRFPLCGTGDPFTDAVAGGHDLILPSPRFAPGDRPHWYGEITDAGSFALLPVSVRRICVGAIYCEYAHGDLEVAPAHLNYLNTLRNQAALAIKQR